MKGYIFVNFFNKRSKGLTMQINFHSLLWSYLPKGGDVFGHDCICVHMNSTHWSRHRYIDTEHTVCSKICVESSSGSRTLPVGPGDSGAGRLHPGRSVCCLVSSCGAAVTTPPPSPRIQAPPLCVLNTINYIVTSPLSLWNNKSNLTVGVEIRFYFSL